MSRLHLRYREYRRVGFGPLSAFRLAWLVSTEELRPIPLRITHGR